MTVRPAKTRISRGIHLVWSESLLCAQWVAKDLSLLHADSKDSDQTGWMPRLIWVFAGRTCHFVGFVIRLLIYCVYMGFCNICALSLCISSSVENLYAISKMFCDVENWISTIWLCVLFNGISVVFGQWRDDYEGLCVVEGLQTQIYMRNHRICKENVMDHIFKITVLKMIRAASWQNQQNGSAPSEDSDQPGHPPNLFRVFFEESLGP